jgi:8-oxo-dGTP pyrophosphatase MutT (NUDIX family)
MQGNPKFEKSAPRRAKATESLLGPIPKADAYGGVLVDKTGRVLLREPTGHFGGYVWTFAKGRIDKGETPEQAALREVREETGYEAKIVGLIPTVFVGTTSSTVFFLMTPFGKRGATSDETSKITWVSFTDAAKLIGLTKMPKGRERDLAVLQAAKLYLGAVRPARS